MTSPWKTYGQALKRALWDNVTVVLDAPSLRCGWMDGRCFIAAHAVARIVDGELWGIWSATPSLQQIEHVVVRTPDGAGFLDGDGFSDQKTMLKRWQKELSHRSERPSVALVQLDDAGRPPGLEEVVCQVGLADELERRLRAELPSSYPGMPSGRHANPAPPLRDLDLAPHAMTIDQMRAVLRGMYLPVGGSRADLEARLAHALAVRARFMAMPEELLSSMTVHELKLVLRSIDRPLAGDKARLVAELRRFVAMPLAPQPPRAKPTRRMLAIVWTNPFSGRRELRSWLDDTDAARSHFAQRIEQERWARADAELHHGLRFHELDISLQRSDEGLPQTSDDDLERWAAIVRDVEGRTLPRVGLMMTNAEAHAREERARLARLAEHRQDNPRAIPLDDDAIWNDTRNIVQQLHTLFSQAVRDRGLWAASAYGTLPHNFSLLPTSARLTTRTHVGRKKVDEIYLRVMVREEPETRAFITTGSASLLRDGEKVVSMTVNGSYSALDLARATETEWGPFASQVHDLLRHEITHIADPAHGRGRPRYSASTSGAVDEMAAYFNDPLELRAFMREITDQIRRRIKFGSVEIAPEVMAHKVVAENRIFLAMSKHLTVPNQKLLMRAMAQVAVEEVERRNAEIRAARRYESADGACRR